MEEKTRVEEEPIPRPMRWQRRPWCPRAGAAPLAIHARAGRTPAWHPDELAVRGGSVGRGGEWWARDGGAVGEADCVAEVVLAESRTADAGTRTSVRVATAPGTQARIAPPEPAPALGTRRPSAAAHASVDMSSATSSTWGWAHQQTMLPSDSDLRHQSIALGFQMNPRYSRREPA